MPRGTGPNWRLDEARLQRRLLSLADMRPAIWVDSSDASTVSHTGGNVATVASLAGGPLFSAAGSVRWGDTRLNLLPVLDFDNRSTTQTLQAAWAYSGNAVTLVSVAKSTRSSSGRTVYPRLWSLGPASGNDYDTTDGIIMSYGISPFNNCFIFRNNAVIAQSAAGTDTAWAIHVGTRSSGGGTFSSNGEPRIGGSTSPANLNIARAKIGNDFVNIDCGLWGSVAECLVFTRPLSVLEEAALVGLLAHKWGLADKLPASHRFKNWPPLR